MKFVVCFVKGVTLHWEESKLKDGSKKQERIYQGESMKKDFRIGIVGSRRRNTMKDRKIVYAIVERVIAENPDRRIVIVSGACPKGADEFAQEAHRVYGVDISEFPVPRGVKYASKWEFAKAAFARNRDIAVDSHVGFALVHSDRTGGTENTVSHYLDLAKPVFLVDDAGALYLPSGEKAPDVQAYRDPDKDRTTSPEAPLVGSKE